MRGEEDDEEEWGALLILSWSNERLSGLHHNESTPQMYFYCGALALQGSVWSRQEGCRDSHYYACKEQGLAERRTEEMRVEDCGWNCQTMAVVGFSHFISGRASSSHLERLFFSPPPTRKTHSLTLIAESNHPSCLFSLPLSLSATISSLNFSFSLAISVPLCLLWTVHQTQRLSVESMISLSKSLIRLKLR